MNITIKDVAKAAGVSVATVSRVLNNSANVSESATTLVNTTVSELNYSPNFLGRNLRKCETHVILVIMPSSDQTFYAEITNGMQVTAAGLGYDIISCASNSGYETELRQMNMLFNRTVDGAVLLGTQLNKDELNDLASKYNIGVCCEGVDGANVLTVTVDDEKGGYDAVTALINKGHTKIAIVSTIGKAKSSADREKGYRRALIEHNIAVNEDYIYKNTYDYRNGGYALSHFLKLPDPPTALFAISDLIATGAVKKALKLGINIGKDFAIIGFDGITLSELYSPSISTVAQPCFNMGKEVIEHLIDNMNSPVRDNKNYIIPHTLILRQTTGD